MRKLQGCGNAWTGRCCIQLSWARSNKAICCYWSELLVNLDCPVCLLIFWMFLDSWSETLSRHLPGTWFDILWFSVFLAWSALPDAAAAYEWRSERLASANCGKVASEPARFLETASFMLFRQSGMNILQYIILHICTTSSCQAFFLSRLSSVFGNMPFKSL